MALDTVRIGFLPLVDAALPILAREQGFAEAEGLEIALVRDITWATVRDRLLYGHTDAAHLVAPLALATALGRGRPAVAMAVPFVLGLNGNAITLALPLADQLLDGDALGDPVLLGDDLQPRGVSRRAGGCASGSCIAIRATTTCCATGSPHRASAPTSIARSS